MRRISFVVWMVACLWLPTLAWGVPPFLDYQGVLQDSDGTPLDGSYQMEFRIYVDDFISPILLWEETQTVNVAKGVFSVLLGSVTALPGNLFDNLDLMLGITIPPDGEMVPRQRLSSVAYAFRADQAYWATFATGLQDDVVTSSKILNGSITASDLALQSVGTAHIMYNAVTADQIMDGSVGSGEIQDGSVTGADVQDDSLGGADVQDESLTGADVQDESLTGADIQDGSITSSDLADGSGSGVDADLLDGQDSAAFALAGHDHARIAAPPIQVPAQHSVTTVDSTGNVGDHPWITIGADGLPIIAYYDYDNGDLRVAKCGDTACSSGNTITVVDSAVNVGVGPAIAIGTDDLPVISYLDTTNHDLRVVKCGDAACSSGNTITTVDSAGMIGFSSTSITLGTDGLPIVAYYDFTNKDLKVAKCGNAACSSGNAITTVDSAGDVGEYASIAILANGKPGISYFDGGIVGNPKYVQCGGDTCASGNVFNTIDPNPGEVNGWRSEMTVGTDGLPVIAYFDAAAGKLYVAKCRISTCALVNLREVESTGGVPQGIASITIGANGFPVISYYHDSKQELRLYLCGDMECSAAAPNIIRTLDSTGDVGRHSSVTIGVDGLPIVAYKDETNLDLKVYKCANPFCLDNWTRR